MFAKVLPTYQYTLLLLVILFFSLLTVSVHADPLEGVMSAQVAALRSQAAHALTTKVPATKLEAALTNPSALMLQDTLRLGDVRYQGKAFSNATSALFPIAVSAYEAGKEQHKTKGVIILIVDETTSEACLLDYDDVKSLASALATMSTLSKQWSGSETPHVASYISPGGLNIRLINDVDKKQYVYATCSSLIAVTHQFKEVGNLDSLSKMLQNGIDWLDKQ